MNQNQQVINKPNMPQLNALKPEVLNQNEKFTVQNKSTPIFPT